MNVVLDEIERSARLDVAPPLEVVPTAEGWLLRLQGGLGFWARVGAATGQTFAGPGGTPLPAYAFEEMLLTAGGTFAPVAAGATPAGGGSGPGGAGATQAVLVEANGQAVPPGTVLWVGGGTLPPSGGGVAYLFSSPVYDPQRRARLFWARLTEEATVAGVSRYGYVEQAWDGAGFADREGGRSAAALDVNAAVESGHAAGVAAGTVVLLFAAPADDALAAAGALPPGSPAPAAAALTHAFRAGSAGGDRWARLTGRSLGAAYAVALGAAAQGTWRLVVGDPATADDGDAAAYHSTRGLAATATPADVQAALELAVGVGNVAVAAGPDAPAATAAAYAGAGGPYAVTFHGDWGGGRNPTLTLDATLLTRDPDALADAGLTEAEAAAEAGATRTRAGRTDPYTDGRGSYGWEEVAWRADGTLAAVPGGLASAWPYGAARAASGATHVPEGTVVRLRGTAAVTTAGRADSQRLFEYHGAAGSWAVLGAAGLYEIDLRDPDGRGPTGGYFALAFAADARKYAAATAPSWVLPATPAGVGGRRFYWNPSADLVSATGTPVTLAGTLDAAGVQAALEAWSPLLAGNVAVTGTGTLANNAMTVTLTGDLAAVRATMPYYEYTTGFTFLTATVTLTRGPAATTVLLPYSAGTADAVSAAGVLTALGDVAAAVGGQVGVQSGPAGLHARTADCEPLRAAAAPLTGTAAEGAPRADLGPFRLCLTGYESPDDVPELTVLDFLSYPDAAAAPGTALAAGPPFYASASCPATPAAPAAPGPLGAGGHAAVTRTVLGSGPDGPWRDAVLCDGPLRRLGSFSLQPFRPLRTGDFPERQGGRRALGAGSEGGRVTAVRAYAADLSAGTPAGAVVRLWPAHAPGLADAAGDPAGVAGWVFAPPAVGFWARVRGDYAARGVNLYRVGPFGGNSVSVGAATSGGATAVGAADLFAVAAGGGRGVPRNAVVWCEPRPALRLEIPAAGASPASTAVASWQFTYLPRQEVRLVQYLGAGQVAGAADADAVLEPTEVYDYSWPDYFDSGGSAFAAPPGTTQVGTALACIAQFAPWTGAAPPAGTLPVPGGYYAGRLAGYRDTASGVWPVYVLASQLPAATRDRAGVLSLCAQRLGGHKEFAGAVSALAENRADPVPVAPGGCEAADPPPAAVGTLHAWGDATEHFAGFTGAGGDRFGLRVWGTPTADAWLAPGATLGAGAGSLAADATTLVVPAVPTGWPVPYYLCLYATSAGSPAGTAAEIVRVTAAAGTTLTVERGQGGTTPTAFAAWGVTALLPLPHFGTGVIGPAQAAFWTSLAGWGRDGTPGGTQTVTLPVYPAGEVVLHFAGGLLVGIDYPDVPAGTGVVEAATVYANLTTCPDDSGRKAVTIDRGRVAAVATNPC